MKINEVILTPSENKKLNIKFEHVINVIKTQCSEFLPIYKKCGPLYRGISTKIPEIFMAATPINRKPTDTHQSDQDKFDNLLYKSGFTALRRNSIFCSGDEYFARAYGNVYLIFPLNGFSFTWSLYIQDFFNNPNILLDVSILNSKELVKKYDFKHTELDNAIQSHNEILIHGQYLAISKIWWWSQFVQNSEYLDNLL